MEEKEVLTKQINVTLDGLADLLFDRFVDHSKDKRPPEQKLYMKDGKVGMPGANIESFLFRQLPPNGCALAFEGKAGKNYRAVGTANVFVNESFIPLMRDGKEVIFREFDKDGFYIVAAAPITKANGGAVIKQEMNARPCLALPWSISFSLMLVKNALIDEGKLYNWFFKGGIQLALGNWRPRFGRFKVAAWDVTE